MTRQDWLDLFEERAAIMTDSGMTKTMAEAKALVDTIIRFGKCPKGKL